MRIKFDAFSFILWVGLALITGCSGSDTKRPVMLDDGNWESVSAGGRHCLALKSVNELMKRDVLNLLSFLDF